MKRISFLKSLFAAPFAGLLSKFQPAKRAFQSKDGARDLTYVTYCNWGQPPTTGGIPNAKVGEMWLNKDGPGLFVYNGKEWKKVS